MYPSSSQILSHNDIIIRQSEIHISETTPDLPQKEETGEGENSSDYYERKIYERCHPNTNSSQCKSIPNCDLSGFSEMTDSFASIKYQDSLHYIQFIILSLA